MTEEQTNTPQQRYVYVKDRNGIEYVCRLEDLRDPRNLTEEERAGCMQPPGDA